MMRRLCAIVLLTACTVLIRAVTPPDYPDDDWRIFVVESRQPEFPGGSEALNTWIEKNLRYPVLAEEKGLEARVVAAFWVTGDGSVKHGRILRSGGELFDKEVLRVIRFMPRWIPGRETGRPISVRYTIPFTFHLIPDSLHHK